MMKIKHLLRNRDFIMILSLVAGLVWGEGARWTEGLTLPVLAAVMTLSTMGIRGDVFRYPKDLLVPAFAGIGMSYLLLGGFLLLLSSLLIRDRAIGSGFVILASVPPAVAVIPFTLFLKGNSTFSLIGTMGGYLGALVITPLLTLGLLGEGFIDPGKLVIILLELILIPLLLSRILLRAGIAWRIEPIKGAITNWSFFVICYTIVGLNREVFLTQPITLLPVVIIALASTFFLGWAIEKGGQAVRIEPSKLTSLVLLGTLKNYGLAGGLALALFSKKTALPATVSAVFLVVYIIWLQLKLRKKRWGEEHRG
jgi:BASS family bile acid:Na+ symporter